METVDLAAALLASRPDAARSRWWAYRPTSPWFHIWSLHKASPGRPTLGACRNWQPRTPWFLMNSVVGVAPFRGTLVSHHMHKCNLQNCYNLQTTLSVVGARRNTAYRDLTISYKLQNITTTTFIGIYQPRAWIKTNNIRSIHSKLKLIEALKIVQSV